MSCTLTDRPLSLFSNATGFPLGREMTGRLMALAASYCDSEGGCHGPDHFQRVHQVGLHIGGLMDAKLDIISAAAILHDIGRRYETQDKGGICHAVKGADLAGDILREQLFPEDKIAAIVHCIATHRYRDDNVPLSLEARILFDADKLDSIGAIGIGRAFLFAGQVGAKLHNDSGCIDGTEPYSVEDTAYREFKVKMCKIKNQMLTPEGKRLACERHAFMEIFFERMEKEIRGGCLT